MELISRVKNILVSPKNEWETIDNEQHTHQQILMSYLLILALIPAVCTFIGQGLIGYSVFGVRVGGSIGYGLQNAIISFITMIGSVYLAAFVINMLAESFGSTKNFDKAFALTAYSYTAMCVGGIFYILPKLSWLGSLAGLYGLYILFTGLQTMMKTPEDKKVSYFVVSLVCLIVISIVVSLILGAIATGLFISSGSIRF